ncbi:MAG TPA: MBL fold metallo-hydrolase [Nitrospiraceae bacterium]|nr:MBL fold metallo-hydrolase [Nitrospiraceae bacterium]
MALEDDFCDIVKKARMGQGLSITDLAGRTGLPAGDITVLERAGRQPTKAEIGALASALQLRTEPLTQIALDGWGPAQPAPIGPVETVMGDIGGYAVKGYVLHDGGEALFVDTAYNAEAMLEILDRKQLKLTGVCLTHGHQDHAGGLDVILQHWRVPVYLGNQDTSLLGWRPSRDLLVSPDDGRAIPVGRLTVRCMTTPGHTPGGICYQVEKGTQDVCFVGDTLFAGSIGRSNPFSLYPVHLESVRRRVLTLPEHTILLPGHGPATTVREERLHNPFAASA